MTAVIKKFPAWIRDTVIHGLCNQWSAQIVGSVDDKCRLFDIFQFVTVLIVAEISDWRVFIWSPRGDIRVCSNLFWTAQAFRIGVFWYAGGMKKHKAFIGCEICRIVKIAGCFSFGNGVLIFLGHEFDHPVLFLGPQSGRWVGAGKNNGFDPFWFVIA